MSNETSSNMDEPFMGGLNDSHDGRGPGIAQAAWPAQNLPCDLPDELGQDDLEDGMMDLAGLLAVLAAVCLGGLVLAFGHLAGWF